MAEIVNLNRFRKARRKTDKTRQAVENRVLFGRSKTEKANDRREAERQSRTHAGKELDGKPGHADESEEPT